MSPTRDCPHERHQFHQSDQCAAVPSASGRRAIRQSRGSRRAKRPYGPGIVTTTLGALVAVLVALALFAPAPALEAAAASAGTSAGASTGTSAGTPIPSSPVQRAYGGSSVIGSPAIPVQTGSASGSTPQPNVPAFTANAAAQYALTHPLFRIGGVGAKTVTTVKFMTTAQLGTRVQDASTGLPPGTLICFVELHGTFLVASPDGRTVTYHTAYEVFDATNGYLVLVGAMP